MPFRIGHHFASKLTDYGRGKGLKLQEIPFAEVQRIYEEQAQAKLPLTEKKFREVTSAEYMVFGRKGLGGPQVTTIKASLEISHDAAMTAQSAAQTYSQKPEKRRLHLKQLFDTKSFYN